MAAYATVEQVEAGFRELTQEERQRCEALLEEAAVLIDAVASEAAEDPKRVVSCRMVRRILGDGADTVLMPLGANQASMTAGPYTQQWTIATGGASGELYIGKTERTLLGLGNRVGSYSPVEELAVSGDV